MDAFTTRRADLHADLLTALGCEPTAAGTGTLSAASYRSMGRYGEGQLHIWQAELELGRPLPTVPLWLGGDFAVPLDLEASHVAACVDLRIRQAG